MENVAQQILNGLTLGATYALMALGLAIVFSIIGLVNFAHGELITISAYTMLAMRYLGLPWVVWALAGVLASVLGALVMERLAFRPVRHASPVTMMLTSFGVSVLVAAAFEIGISPRPRAIPQPGWITSSFSVAGLQLRAEHLLTFGVTAVALLGLLLLLRRSLIGAAMRAAAEDFDAVRLMGIKANAVIAYAFAISGLLAGLASVIIMSRRGVATPHMGLTLGLNAFVANVIGGMGNLWGAVAGGFILGFGEVALRAWLPASLSGLTQGFLFLMVAVFLLIWPHGLFGQKTAVRV
ncbi:MAG: branched-chain amino acid ABC transporter permease [Gaiellales bacterium]|nr:branched-chain amino acid ABC transporter permease [Gaiellales bacterium]